MKWPGVATIVVVICACAPIRRTETVVTRPLEPNVERRVIDGSRAYTATPDIRGDLFALEIEQADRCEVLTTPRTQRTRRIARSTDKKVMTTIWGLAVMSVALGAYAYADAEGLSAEDQAMNPYDYTTPEEYRQAGAVFVGLGLGTALLGIVDELRAVDTVEDGGIADGPPQRTETTCRRAMTRDERVVVTFQGGVDVAGRTDDNGRVELSLSSLPLSALPAADGTIDVSVIGARIQVTLTDPEVSEIMDALLANPASRASRDLVAQRRSRCAEAISTARASSRSEIDSAPESVTTAWDTAKSSCGDLWTAENEAESIQSHEAAGAARCMLALRTSAELVSEPLVRDSVASVEQSIENAADVCDDEHASQLKAVRSKYAKALARLEVQEREDAKRAALVESMIQVEDALANEDPRTAYAVLAGNPGLKKLVTMNGENLAWHNLRVAIDNVLVGNPSRKEAATSMCYARKVFQTLVGQGALRRAVQRFVASVGTHDPAYAARVVKAVKAGRCR